MKRLSRILIAVCLLAPTVFAQKTLTIDRPSDPASLDPHFELTAPGSWVYSQVIETLVTLNQDMELEPLLAESWEFVEPTRVRFNLRQDVLFHDGTRFDAHAVKYVWDRGTVGDPPARWIAFTGLIDGVEVVDDFTVDITTSSPYGPLLYTLTPPYMGIPSPASIEEHGDAFGRNPVGTGPFTFDSWQANDRIVLNANEDYWAGRPALDRIVFRTVPEEGSRMNALRTGETDMVLLPGPSQLADLANQPGFVVEGAPGVGVFNLNFNLTMPFVSELPVRQAIAHAIDRELIVSAVLEGGGVLARSVIGDPIFGFHDMQLEERYPYDPELAVQLLEEAGYSRGSDGIMVNAAGDRLQLDFLASSGRALMDREIAEVVQEFLRQVGIDVRIDFFEWATTSAILREAEIPYHLTSQAFYTANGDADFALFPNFHSASLPPAGWNRAAYANADVDAWLEQAQASLDDAERLQLYAQVQEQLATELPALPIYGTLEVAAHSGRVTGFRAHPVNYLLTLYPVDVE